jgi:hypothetical protein
MSGNIMILCAYMWSNLQLQWPALVNITDQSTFLFDYLCFYNCFALPAEDLLCLLSKLLFFFRVQKW